jgi:hypothetical protein
MTQFLIFKQFKNIFTLLLFGVILFPNIACAAKLYLEPSEGEYYQGDTFIVKVKIDTEDECINTVEAKIEFSQDILEPIDFSRGDSILSLWVKEPNFSVISCNEPGGSCGLVEFSGGIPGGYCGIIPGDPGESNLLGEIIFRAISSNISPISTQVAFQNNSQVLLNDGFGTSSKLTAKGAVFTISPEKLKPPKDEWQEEIRKDTILPEPFQIEVLKEPLMFEGKYFIIFQTLDKQTGLDYYEVKEGKKDWQKAESPYLLKDQNLEGIIKVKAVDKAGNERIAEHSPLKITKKVTKKTLKIIFIYGAIIVCLIMVGWTIKKKLIR